MNELIISNTTIRQNSNNLYCLNDLHKASGGHNADRPQFWLRTKQAIQYIELLNSESGSKNSCFEVIKGGEWQGSYASKELVYSYAMWISVKFHHEVIKTYDAVINGIATLSKQDAEMLRITRINPNTLKAITGERSNNAVRKNYQALVNAELLEEHVKVVYKRIYLPTQKALDYVSTSHHDIVRFKPEYHELVIDAVTTYKQQLSSENMDLFLNDESLQA